MHRPRPVWLSVLFLILLLEGCGGSGNISGGGGGGGGSNPTTSTVAVTPAASTATTAQTLSVAIAVTGSGAAPTGSVVLSSGAYASFAATLAGGTATVSIPAGLLAVGSDTLTAAYTPDSGSSAAYKAATGTATVNISAAGSAPAVTLSSVTYPTMGAPFQAAVNSAGVVFVGESGGGGNGIEVFVPGGGGLTSSCFNSLSASLLQQGASVSNLSFLPNGTDLAAGIGDPGAAFFNLSALESCTASGTVVSQGALSAGEGTQEVAVTPDGKFAFASNEYGVVSGTSSEGNIGVVSLQYDSAGDVTSASTLLGQISTGGNAIAGMTLSPDGTRLYVTSEVAPAGIASAGSGNPVLTENDCVQSGGAQPNGILTVIDVAKAESAPGQSAVLATVNAGCSPVRMAETADGSTLWVAIRGDNRVLAFSTGMLELNAGNALLGYADTGGTAPVGIRLFHNNQLLAVANSNRFETGTANSTVLYVAVPATAAVVQTTQTGLFPREIEVGPDDATLYLTNYDSGTLQVISTTVQ